MANLFDRDNYPTQEPDTLVVGDRWVWRRNDLITDYPSDTYSLTYHFTRDSGGGGTHHISITATAITDAYIVEVASATTASLGDGDYVWQAYITRTSDSQRFVIDTGQTKLLPDFDNDETDMRSFAKKALDSLEAVIQNRATIDQSSFSIAGRSLSRMSVDELLTLRDRFQAEYNKEVKLNRIKNKQNTGNTIGVRF